MRATMAMTLLLVACGDDGATTAGPDAAPCFDGGHDEDGDGVGDRCDICPASPDPRQLDNTERATGISFPDGVGDACDPRPNQSGDKLGAFHPFVDPATAAAWTGAGWTIDGDHAHADGDARWVNRTREQGDGVFVQARISELAWQAGGRFEIVVDGDGVETGITCAIAKDRDGDGNDEIETHELGGAPVEKSVAMPITGAITLTAWRFIDPQRVPHFFCRLKFDGGMANAEATLTDDLAIGIYGIAQTASTTNVESVVVYTSPLLPGDNR